MTARKRWRVVWSPGSHYERVTSPGSDIETMPSKKRAYEIISEERGRIEAGSSTTASATVQVDQGAGWETYERLDFHIEEHR